MDKNIKIWKMQRRGYSLFRAVDLVLLSILKKLSEPEKEELERMKQETGLQQHAGELFDPAAVQELLRQESPFDTEEAYRRFLGKVSRKLPRQSSRGVFHWLRYAALWLLPLMAGGALLWYMTGEAYHEDCVEAAVIKPVATKAVVVLADGRRIDLSQGLQEIPEQDGTVVQRDSGQLVYGGSRVCEGKEMVYNTLDVPRGGEYSLILADGTKVSLNSETQLRFPVHFSSEKREVYLCGEAYFSVVRDTARPFIVHTSRGDINVLGTSFNVRDYQDEKRVVTTLVSGVVRYEGQIQPGHSVVLRPGFQVHDGEGDSALVVQKVRLQEYIGWKDGLYVFNHLTLEEMMKTVERNYDVNVFFTNDKLKHLRFSGDLKKYDQVEHFLKFIETGGDVSFVVKGRTITVQPK